jgi:hypothetical protein
MQVQVNTDDNVTGRAELIQWVQSEVSTALSRFAAQITRVEVHLGDENAGKSGAADKRCRMEVRPAGMQPLVVTQQAATLGDACRGAIRKLKDVLDSRLGRLQDHKGDRSIRDEEA